MSAPTLAEVLRGVRDLSPHFEDRYTPNGILMRALNRYQARLLGKITDPKRDVLLQDSTEVLLAGFDFDVGATVTASIEYLGGDVVFKNSEREPEPLELLPYARRHQLFFRWAAWINPKVLVDGVQAPRLMLLGTDADWTGVEKIILHRAQNLILTLTALTSTFQVPGDCGDVLVCYGATICARRARDQGLEVDVERFDSEWMEAEEAYLDQVTGRKRAQVGRAQETW